MAQVQSTEGASEVIEAIRFSFMTDDEVEQHSFLKVTNPILLDTVDRPMPGGLYDPSLGPLEDRTPCKSCGQLKLSCPGHCGHIELVYPVYHPLLFNYLHSLLQRTCFTCHHFRTPRAEVENCVSQLKLILKGDVVGAKRLNPESDAASSFTEENDGSYGSTTSVYPSTDYQEFDNQTSQQWTSLQFTEANLILNKFLKKKSAKCLNCGAKNPSVGKPTFGWFHMGTMLGAAIRENVIRSWEIGEGLGVVEDADENIQSDGIENSVGSDASKRKRAKQGKAASEYIKQKSLLARHLLPTEVKKIIEELWENEPELCSFIGNLQQHQYEKKLDSSIFFLENVLVPPTKFRAPTKGGDKVMEHPQTVLLSRVLQSNISLGNAHANNLEQSKMISRWMDLQQSINVLFDSKTASGPGQRDMGTGICQLLEKKEGVFRQKMMGKRVNFACRSVISPDPYLAVNEIGIPPFFALRLTYPERVTPWNVAKLREAIMNGSDIHPGATHYADKLSTIRLPPARRMRIPISRKLPSSRGALMEPGKGDYDFEGKVVYRHLRDGDVVLVNRQPTLHKPSIMAHVVRVLKGEKTIRMHYANCSTYNADFDGDEMNVHFPQDEISRSEAYNIVNANNQYVRPSNGDPIRALIQDHIVSAVLLTKRDTFLDREKFNQLLFGSGVSEILSTFSGKPGKKVFLSAGAEILSPEPAILKPVPLWTGKQVVTAVLNYITKGEPPFTIEKAAKIPRDFFKTRSVETKPMSKQKINEEYKSAKESKNESWKRELDEDRLVIRKNYFVQGVIDKAQFADYGLVHIVHELYGAKTAGILLSALSRLFTLYLQMHGFTCGVDDLLIKKDEDNERTRQLEDCENVGERVLFKVLGIDNGAKIGLEEMKLKIERMICHGGEDALASLDRSIVNELNQCTNKGVMNDLLSAGLLKSMGKNCISLMTISGAKGSKVNFQQISSHLGQQDLEGKRVPRMVSGKTLPCFHPWDWVPRSGGFISDRFLTGLRPQEYYFHCMAGREGLVDTAVKTSRSGYLQRCLIKNLECLKVGYDYTVRDADGSIVQFQYGEDGVDVHRTSFIMKFKELIENQEMILRRCSQEASPEISNCYITELPPSLKTQAKKFVEELPMETRITLNLVTHEELFKLTEAKYFSSLAQPGEPVGVLAAQSVGEPSTQMTLNTFHLAGRGEMNVTLGIPRLQEILMTASSEIKTPIMTCPLLKGKSKVDANKIADRVRKITVADVIEGMEVSVVPFAIKEDEVCSIHKLKIKLYVPEYYPKHTDVTIETWEETMSVMFLRELEDAIQNHLVLLSRISGIKNIVQELPPKAGNDPDETFSEVGPQNGEDNEDNDDADGQNLDDLGMDALKRKQQIIDEMDYEDGSELEQDAPSSHMGDGGKTHGLENADEGEMVEEDMMDAHDEGDEIDEGKDGLDSEKASESSGQKSKPEFETIGAQGSKKKRAKFVPKDTDRSIFVKAKGMHFEVHFKFTNEPHILLAQIAERAAKKVYIQNSGRIERCRVIDCCDAQVIYYGENPKVRQDVKVEDKKALSALHVAGIDFNFLWKLQDEVDVRYLYSNDIHAMLNTYGVEAARETIIREINHVFKSYGISVSTRHLSLIADYMTHTGGYRPMSRMGGIADSTSPFSRMSFETASRFILQAATYGEVDDLETPSARICLGLPVKSGTGCFDLMQQLDV